MIAAKTFYELNNQELYQILRLRSEVFVVEQDCVYQDLDNKDQISIHIFQKEKDEIVAYTRIFKRDSSTIDFQVSSPFLIDSLIFVAEINIAPLSAGGWYSLIS